MENFDFSKATICSKVALLYQNQMSQELESSGNTVTLSQVEQALKLTFEHIEDQLLESEFN